MEYIHEIKKGFSLYLKFKGWYIGSISAIVSDTRVSISKVGTSIFIRYDSPTGLIQYVCDEYEEKRIGD